MTRAERLAGALTLRQIEKLILAAGGRQTFRARDAISISSLVDKELVTGKFDISAPDPLRGRVHEIWREVTLTALGVDALAVCLAVFANADRSTENSQ